MSMTRAHTGPPELFPLPVPIDTYCNFQNDSCGSPKCHRTRGALRISNIQFEAERRELKQNKA
jgi:hypothetical protein